MGLPPIHEEFETYGIDIYHFESGKIKEGWKMHTGKTFTAEVQKDRTIKGLKLTIMLVSIMGLHYFQYHHQQETRQSRQYE
jgi:hypothetical protein